MADFGNGYEPVPGFMEKHCRTLTMFHDAAAYDAEVHGPGLLTGVSKFGKRIYYESERCVTTMLRCGPPPTLARTRRRRHAKQHAHSHLAGQRLIGC